MERGENLFIAALLLLCITQSFANHNLAPVSTSSEADSCRQLAFGPANAFDGNRLLNHVIRTVDIVQREFCGALCFMELDCVSYNIGVISGSTTKCELNNSTHNEHPEDLKPWNNYIYQGAVNPCGKNPCHNNATCQTGFTDNGYRCLCTSGFTGQDCKDDIDECQSGAAHECDVNAVCNNTQGSYNCTCKDGYYRDGETCTDINECSAANKCDVNAVCDNTQGSYNCTCEEGYDGDGETCTDINDCSAANKCDVNAVCNNTQGSYNCTCEEGYYGDGQNCTDIDECSATNKCDVNAVCNNTQGSYNCTCEEGYDGDGRNCTDINECATGTHECSADAVCNNTKASYNCSCNPGYYGDGRHCQDIDECATGTHKCKVYDVCNNTKGSYNCTPLTCQEIYQRNLSRENKAYEQIVGSEKILVYCHLNDTGLGACSGGSWTLVMKINGSQQSFHYESSLWTNNETFNVTGGETGFDSQETKLPTYWNTPFTKICLGMKIHGEEETAFIVINKMADSLFSVIADSQYRATSLGRGTWKTLIGSEASLQLNCNKEGFNAVGGSSSKSKARIGFIANNQKDCSSCNSRIGFGTGGRPDNSNTCGNVAILYPDNGDKNIQAMGYILVQ